MEGPFDDMNKKGGNDDFGMPEGYFENSAARIMNRIEWMEEHKEYPVLSSMKGKSGFVVPVNYFENSEVRMELLEMPELMKLKGMHGFITPQEYFEGIELREQSLIGGEENELAMHEKLSRVEKKNPFAVPADYFENSAGKLNEVLQPKARVITLFRASVWYSAAAAALVLCLGIWLYQAYFKGVEKDCTSLACIDKSELLKLKNMDNVDSEELFEMVDTQKLQENLEKKDESKKSASDDSSVDKENKDSLSGISTDDLPDDL